MSCDRNTLFGASLTSRGRQVLPMQNDFSNNGLSLPRVGSAQTLPCIQQYYSVDLAHLTFVSLFFSLFFSNSLVYFAPEIIFEIVCMLFLRYCEWKPCGYFITPLSWISYIVGESSLWRWSASWGWPHSFAKEKALRWKPSLLHPALDTGA